MNSDDKVFHEIYIGSTIGSFKRYNSKLDTTTTLNDLKTLEKGDEIRQLTWTDSTETEILLSQTNGVIKTYNINTETLKTTKQLKLSDKEYLVGIGVTPKLVTGTNNGVVTIWNKTPTEIQTNGVLEKMRVFETQCGTGGKENPLKIWDLSTGKNIFTAKNIPNDFLELRVPIWVSDLSFLSMNEVATCSRYDNICFYDIRAQRRPITRIECPDSAYSCITPSSKERQVCVGGGKGILQLIDLRKPGHILHKYKGSVGAVKDISVHSEYLFSCGFDRRLRIHHVEKPQLLSEVYLKTRLNCLLVKKIEIKEEKKDDDGWIVEDVIEEIIVEKPKKKRLKGVLQDSGDYLYENADVFEDDVELTEKRKIKRKKVKNEC